MIGLAALLGLVVVACAALLERRLGAAAEPPAGAGLDARLRAGFPRATAPWIVATAAAALALAATLAWTGPTALALGALVAGAAGGAVAVRRAAGLLAAVQVGALAAASWVAGSRTDDLALAWTPAALGVIGALTSLVGVGVARVGPPGDAEDAAAEGHALARALVRPVVVAAALLLLVAELLVARLQLPGADVLRAPVGLGVILAVALTVGAPWPLPGWGARGGGLLQVGALLRPLPVLVALVAAGAGLVLAVEGALGVALAAATIVALSAAPLGAASFCDGAGAPATGSSLRQRVGAVPAALTLAAVTAAVASPSSADRPVTPARDAGPSMVGAPLSPERDE